MATRILHDMTDEELEDFSKALHQKVKAKGKKVKMPAINPAQAHVSRFVAEQYKKIMINQLAQAVVDHFKDKDDGER